MRKFTKNLGSNLGKVCAVIGGQWGDEGKGKLIDILAGNYDVIVRAAGGANAGHTIYREEHEKFVFHLVPSGIFHPWKICVMGNGMVVHLQTLFEEIETLKKAGVNVKNRLFLSERSHLVFDYHKVIDGVQEESKGGRKVGTTRRGIGPAYSDKTSRIGIRAAALKDFKNFSVYYRKNLDLLKKMHSFEYDGEAELNQIKKMLSVVKPLITDTSLLFSSAIKKNKKILLEGANGVLLDIDHGTYPFVTSSNASVGGLITGSGIPPKYLSSVIGIMKAYITRVGGGPFPTELKDDLGDKIRQNGMEFGATTGRPRRCGWFDAVAARYSMRINGFSAINLTKLDVLNSLPYIKIGVSYSFKGKRIDEFPENIKILEQCKVSYIKAPGWQKDISGIKTFDALPKNCKSYIRLLEKLIGCPILFIGTGKRSDQMIYR